ncbi:MAG: divergent polysaccharide deacetylase family protein [Paracoccaceae bacterium]
MLRGMVSGAVAGLIVAAVILLLTSLASRPAPPDVPPQPPGTAASGLTAPAGLPDAPRPGGGAGAEPSRVPAAGLSGPSGTTAPARVGPAPRNGARDLDGAAPDAPPDAQAVTVALSDLTPDRPVPARAQPATPAAGTDRDRPAFDVRAPAPPREAFVAAEPPLTTPAPAFQPGELEVVEIAVDAVLVANAAPPAQTGGRPAMAVILRDGGEAPDPVDALSILPFRVTVALDPTADGAVARAAALRAAGHEVISLFAPDRTLGLDLAIGTLAPEGLPDPAVEALRAAGAGLVGQRIEGVASAELFRDLDPTDQDARVVRRFLDQAAFRARNAPGVIVQGRMRPDTLTALTLWGTSPAGQRVAVVPVSQLLSGGADGG